MLESEQVEGRVIKSLHIRLNALKEPLEGEIGVSKRQILTYAATSGVGQSV